MAQAKPKQMAQVLILVSRGVTDKTPVLVWPWEVPVLETIHGEGNVIECDHAETEAFLKRTKVHILPAPRVRPETEEGGTNIHLPDDFNPANDVGQEFERLVGKYGMHLEIKMPNVEYVYGRLSEGRFEKAVLTHCKPTREVAPTFVADSKKMTGAEIRAELDRRDIEYDPAARVSSLRELLEVAIEREAA